MYWQDAQSTSLKTLFNYTRIGLITDMDGTISPIVPRPDDALPTKRNRDLLHQLHQHLALVAVISGRAAADVRQRVNLPELVYVGNHGLERWHDGDVVAAPEVEPYIAALAAARAVVERIAPEGMWVEDKRATLSVHYRAAADPTAVTAEYGPLMQQIADDNGLHLFPGRMIFELRPPLDVNKGTAFATLVDQYALDAAVFVGDDTTDADAMRVARALRHDGRCYSLAVAVESDDMPAVVAESADLLTSGVNDVESFFSWLLMAASASST